MTSRNYGKSLTCYRNHNSANAFVNGELVLESLAGVSWGIPLDHDRPRGVQRPRIGHTRSTRVAT
uniref:hypothetical protein n=1 Tax=Psychroserpens mesophilus TaxID=325473 RepID=UPI003D64D10B